MIGNYFRTDEKTIELLQRGEKNLEDFLDEDKYQDSILDIDKTWHAIQYTLTGKSYGSNESILSKLVLNGNELTNQSEELTPTLITASEVKELANALKEYNEEDFKRNFDVEKMLSNEVYPITADENESDFFEYVWEYFIDLKGFIQTAAKKNEGAIFFII